jgi:acetyl esterase/lipase
MRRVIDGYLAGHPVEDPIVSPLLAELAGLPPLLVQAATGDHVLDEARRLAERAQEHGVDTRIEVFPAETHVFHVFWSFLPEAADALQQAGAFIRDRLREQPQRVSA